jgi:hypothetical protein
MALSNIKNQNFSCNPVDIEKNSPELKRVFGIKILMNSHMSFFVANAGHAAELEYL